MVISLRSLKRQQRIAEWEERIKMLHEKYPRLDKISKEFVRISLQIALQEAGNSKNKFKKEELEKNLKELQREKKALLEEYHLPANIYDIWWECEKCQDTGFKEVGVKCECLLKEEGLTRWILSGLAPEQEKQVFENFSLNWYDEKERYIKILETVQIFAYKVARGERVDNLLFYGGVGTGKTHLCSAVANYVLKAGRSVVYLKVGRLLDLIRKQKFKTETGEEKDDFLKALYEAELLIIDDLGTENVTDFVREQLLNVIDERLNYQLPWVISTNLSPNTMDAIYEDRLVDRIINTSQALKFTGESIRQKKKLQQGSGV